MRRTKAKRKDNRPSTSVGAVRLTNAPSSPIGTAGIMSSDADRPASLCPLQRHRQGKASSIKSATVDGEWKTMETWMLV